AELALLVPGVPAPLLPPPGPPAAPVPPGPPPVGSPAEAIALVREHLHVPFGAYRMAVAGDPPFTVDSRELVYQVRWDVPAEEIKTVGPPLSYPGDPVRAPYREPGWLVDRVSREVHPVDLSSGALDWYVAPRRTYPLPPGWRPAPRPSLADGFAAALPPASPVTGEAVARY